MVPEIIRYQSPVVHMRRTALCDAELNGKRIHKGEIQLRRDARLVNARADRPASHLIARVGASRDLSCRT